jgi:hypothetical protein
LTRLKKKKLASTDARFFSAAFIAFFVVVAAQIFILATTRLAYLPSVSF